MTNQQANSPHWRKKISGVIAVIAAVFALCTVMKTFVCGKFAENCPCQAASDQPECGCSSSQEE